MRNCPGCHDRSARVVGTANGFRLVRCSRCGTVFTGTVPATQDEAMDYASYYHEENLEIPRCVQQRLETLARGFSGYRVLNRWLDVGCGAGALMRAAARDGWVAVGTEVAPTAADAVRTDGFEVHLGLLENSKLAHASFDVVSVIEVVEHVADAEALLRGAHRVLRPGGALYLTTPNGRGISARMLGARWSAVAPPEHLQLFSLQGVAALVDRVGLRVQKTHAHAVNPRELLTLLHRPEHRPSCDRVATGYRLNESLSRSRGGIAAKTVANAALSALTLGDTLKVTAERPS
jgi:2-polyprenyl-3-methyl-5-hydroxy-6-metoxy-1,4-benzoquinol methylase